MARRPCSCGSSHASWEVRAVARFAPALPIRYQAWNRPAPPRATREEAMRDVCPSWQPAQTTEEH